METFLKWGRWNSHTENSGRKTNNQQEIMGSKSNSVVFVKSPKGSALVFSFFALLNNLTKILLDHDTLTKMTESLKAKGDSFDDLDQVVLSLYFSVSVRKF